MARIKPRLLFSGISEIKDNLKKVSKKATYAGNAGIYAVGVAIIENAKRRVPVDTGALQASGYATEPKGNNTVEIGFGGNASVSRTGTYPEAYAVIQHEVAFHHTIGEDHYLLHAIEDILNTTGLRTFARTAQKIFETGGGYLKSNVPT